MIPDFEHKIKRFFVTKYVQEGNSYFLRLYVKHASKTVGNVSYITRVDEWYHPPVRL